ncbi:MAG: RNA 2',3'-cyclic phosphodiesterase [Actinobacteria bacterium]|nr:RNA 2',3'-cyclic phosphodiesterase [Actinomycetota bacterium]
MSLRVFLALELDDLIKKQLARLQHRLSAVGADIRWVKSDQIHLTMKFLGELTDKMAVDVCRLCQNVSAEFTSFEFGVHGAGCFSNHGQPRVLWVGITDPSGSVRRLHERLEKTLGPLGLRRELRAFRPHVTLGRARSGKNAQDLRLAVEKNKDFEVGIQQAQEITIFSSQLSPDGPLHTVIGRAVFGDEPASPLPGSA